jgi:hypothetical protein
MDFSALKFKLIQYGFLGEGNQNTLNALVSKCLGFVFIIMSLKIKTGQTVLDVAMSIANMENSGAITSI